MHVLIENFRQSNLASNSIETIRTSRCYPYSGPNKISARGITYIIVNVWLGINKITSDMYTRLHTSVVPAGVYPACLKTQRKWRKSLMQILEVAVTEITQWSWDWILPCWCCWTKQQKTEWTRLRQKLCLSINQLNVWLITVPRHVVSEIDEKCEFHL